MTRILFVVPSLSALPDGSPTGFWLEELAAPFNRCLNAGFDVAVASLSGGRVTPDPASMAGEQLTQDGVAFRLNPVACRLTAAAERIAAVNPRDQDAIFVVGGVAASFEFGTASDLDALLDRALEAGVVLAAVCHGTIAFTRIGAPGGGLAAAGHDMTGFSLREEQLFGLEAVVPVVPEQAIVAAGARYVKAAEPGGVCVAEGRHFLTGQNPASAGPLAERMIERLLGPSLQGD